VIEEEHGHRHDNGLKRSTKNPIFLLRERKRIEWNMASTKFQSLDKHISYSEILLPQVAAKKGQEAQQHQTIIQWEDIHITISRTMQSHNTTVRSNSAKKIASHLLNHASRAFHCLDKNHLIIMQQIRLVSVHSAHHGIVCIDRLIMFFWTNSVSASIIQIIFMYNKQITQNEKKCAMYLQQRE
ncbi:hypothetical protein ACJX0J_037982, partial [Zea mays]